MNSPLVLLEAHVRKELRQQHQGIYELERSFKQWNDPCFLGVWKTDWLIRLYMKMVKEGTLAVNALGLWYLLAPKPKDKR